MERTTQSDHTRRWRAGLLLGCLAGLAGSVFSQESIGGAGQTATDFQFGSGDLLLPNFAPESEADDDLGIQLVLQPASEYEPFLLSAWTGYYFTDNANLSETAGTEDHVWTSAVALSYLPVIAGNLYGEATVRDQLFRYNALSDLDFNAVDAGAGFVYVFRKLNDLSASVRYNYARFSDPTVARAENYENHSIQVGLYEGWTLTRNQFLYASWRSDLSLDGDPGYAKRDDHSLTVGYRLTPREKIKLESFFRAAFLDFAGDGRDDWNTAVGASFTYNFTRNLYAAAFVSYTSNDSNLDINSDYEAWQTGIRLGGNWKF